MSLEKYECYYCDRVFPYNYMMKEHVSYGHNALREVYGSKFYKDIYNRIKNLETLLEEKDKIITQNSLIIKSSTIYLFIFLSFLQDLFLHFLTLYFSILSHLSL